MKDTKLYRVELGFVDDEGGDSHNWSSKRVIAIDAPTAIKKTRLRKNEYVIAVEMISTVDVR